MTGLGAPVAGAIFAALAVAYWWQRRQWARDVAERWLRTHRYRVRQLRTPLLRLTPFGASLWRDSKKAVDFRAVVDDMDLGGTGTVWLRVWTDWLGTLEGEPEVQWERMPDRSAPHSEAPEERWADAQLALLRRVAAGETRFRPEGRDAAAGAAFDELVEHLLALQRRGLVTCQTPIADLRGHSQYAAVTDVALTDDGRRELVRRAAPR